MSNNQNHNQHKTYSTDYFPLICAFVYHGLVITSVNRHDPRRAYFEFERTSQLETIVQKFWSEGLLVEPKRFFAVTKEVKNRLFEPNYD